MASINPEATKFTVSVVHEIDAARVTDLLVTAFENHITTQWCSGAQLKSHGPLVFSDFIKSLDRIVPMALKRSHEAAFRPIEQSPWYSCPNLWTGDFEIEFSYYKDDEPVTKIVKRADFLRALSQMAQRHPRHFNDFIEEDEDAITGDVFLQLAVLGDVIYG